MRPTPALALGLLHTGGESGGCNVTAVCVTCGRGLADNNLVQRDAVGCNLKDGGRRKCSAGGREEVRAGCVHSGTLYNRD